MGNFNIEVKKILKINCFILIRGHSYGKYLNVLFQPEVPCTKVENKSIKKTITTFPFSYE